MKKGFFLLCCISMTAQADSVAVRTGPHIKYSDNHQLIIVSPPEVMLTQGKMLKLERYQPIPIDPSYSVTYQLFDDGTHKEQWRIEVQGDEYPVHLSNDGQYLITAGGWASGCGANQYPAVAFFKNGQLLKRYAVEDLIENKNSVECTASHYIWRSRDHSYPQISNNVYALKTIENRVIRFDITTGKILNAISAKDNRYQ
ncbi:hypothetical protein VST7929_03025 [Vibrio stylophorae]|uniref:Uncharacterized protein n=1 Tax=Vibrio stylophorae TaxID=659351 RepID=A0ABN8E089_9VIBR|nr:hypothetical protein [Vibrio stylophorae]CAH0535451.1 hypothetical protein VST7929_03025 [Vibrio stylophorae]